MLHILDFPQLHKQQHFPHYRIELIVHSFLHGMFSAYSAPIAIASLPQIKEYGDLEDQAADVAT